MNAARRVDLVCPAGSLPALKAAVDNGADWRLHRPSRRHQRAQFRRPQFRRRRRARRHALRARAAARRCCSRSTPIRSPPAGRAGQRAVDRAADLGVDAVIVADAGLMRYAARAPSAAAAASVGAGLGHQLRGDQFLPRALRHRARGAAARAVARAGRAGDRAARRCEIEVFGFGSLCVMVEGRCALSSYATGESPNTVGVCSPAKAVRWEQTPARPRVAPERRADRPLRDGRERGLSDAVQGPLRRSTARPTTRSRSPRASTRSSCCRSCVAHRRRARSRSRAGSAAPPTSRR